MWQRRCWMWGGKTGNNGVCQLPQESETVPGSWRQDSKGSYFDWSSWYWKDSAGKSNSWRSQRSIHYSLRFRVSGDVCWRWTITRKQLLDVSQTAWHTLWWLISFCHAMLCIGTAYVVIRCLSICLSRLLTLSKQINISSKLSDSRTILLFHTKHHGIILMGTP